MRGLAPTVLVVLVLAPAAPARSAPVPAPGAHVVELQDETLRDAIRESIAVANKALANAECRDEFLRLARSTATRMKRIRRQSYVLGDHGACGRPELPLFAYALHAGEERTFVCPRLLEMSKEGRAAVLMHEWLHTHGMKGHELSSAWVTQRLYWACFTPGGTVATVAGEAH